MPDNDSIPIVGDVELSAKEGLIDMMQFVSSNLHSGLYDRAHQDLYIRFHGDRIYIYRFVPEDEWEGLKSASSHGSYHYHNIRMDYAYEELSATDWPAHGRAAPQNNETVRRFLD